MTSLFFGILIVSMFLIIIVAAFAFGYKVAKDKFYYKPCPYCGHSQDEFVTMEDIDKELDKNFKVFDDNLTKLLSTWKTVKHQADLHEKEMHQRVIDAHLD